MNNIEVYTDMVVEGTTVGEVIAEITAMIGRGPVGFEVIEERGSGGGWPFVMIEFDDVMIAQEWLTIFCGGDAGQAEEMIAEAGEA